MDHPLWVGLDQMDVIQEISYGLDQDDDNDKYTTYIVIHGESYAGRGIP